MKKSSLLRNHQARKPRQKAMLIRSRDWPAVTSSSNFTKAEWIKEEQPNTNKNSFRQQNKSSFTTGAKTNHQKENRRTFFYNFSPKLCVAHRLSPMQECVLVPHIACMFENMSKWGNHTFCFRNHLRCFKVQLTPCVKSTRATTTLAGLQFSTPGKDVTNRSRSMWQLIFIWQAKSAQAIQAISSTHALFAIFFIQDLSLRHYATPRRPIWRYLVRENGEVRLWEFAGDNEGVIRCVQDEMVSLPWESE